MPSRTPISTASMHAISLGAVIVAFGFVASGCAALPPGLYSGSPLARGSGGSLTGGGTGTPAPAPTPAVAPASPPDFVVAPPSGAADPVPLQPGTGSGGPGGGLPISYPGEQPIASPGGGGGPIPLPTSTSAPGQGTFLSDQEAVVLQLTDQARAQAGLKALVQTQPLTSIAESRSQDMGTRDYFSHVTPDGQNVFDMLTAAGIPYTSAGENIAMNSAPAGQTAQTAFTAWMSDSGHKANILSTAFGHIGIGVYQTSAGMTYLTQDFTN